MHLLLIAHIQIIHRMRKKCCFQLIRNLKLSVNNKIILSMAKNLIFLLRSSTKTKDFLSQLEMLQQKL